MNIDIKCQYEFINELRVSSDFSSVPLHSETVTGDLVEEAHMTGLLKEKLPLDVGQLSVEIEPVWKIEPIVEKIIVRLKSGGGAGEINYEQCFSAGRWVRSARLATLRLRDEGTLAEDQVANRLLIALSRSQPTSLRIPPPGRTARCQPVAGGFRNLQTGRRRLES